MAEYRVIYESQENIFGRFAKSKEWVKYRSVLRVKDGGKMPVSLEMTFVPPYPFHFNMPETHRIQGTSVTDVYAKVVKFFGKFGVDFKN